MFTDVLKSRGWRQVDPRSPYVKNEWSVQLDTSSWLIVSTRDNPRVFDVHVPGDYESVWTVNLIEHQCQMEDERRRLREALEQIRDDPSSGLEARARARETLAHCYHSWLVNLKVSEGRAGPYHCPACGQTTAEITGDSQ